MAMHHQESTLLDDTPRKANWRWMVLISCFFTKMFAQGIRKSFGVLLPTLEKQFSTEVWLLGSTVAIFCAFADFLGPIVGGLARRFTCRVIAMIGGVLLCLGVCLASQTTNVLTLAICLVAFCGPGLGLINDTPFAVLGDYFPKDYAIANGFAFLGSSAALIIFGPITQILNEVYGWSGAVLLLGGIFFHMTICGALLMPPSKHPTGAEKHGYYSLKESTHDSRNETKDRDTNDCLSMASQCCYTTYDSLHLSIFKEPMFYVIVIVTSTIRFSHMGWVMYLVPSAVSNGVDPLRATLAATVGGVGDAMGKIIPGIILWKKLVDSKTVWICGMAMLSLSLVLYCAVQSFSLMLVLSFFQGLGLGISHSLNNVVFKDVFGTERLVNAMGWVRCFTGLARLLGGFLPGWIYSSTGSYDYGYVTLGCVQAFGIFILFVGNRCISTEKKAAY